MIGENIQKIRSEIAAAGRNPSDVMILAAVKTFGAEAINSLKQYGISDIGENRVQELLEKYDSVSGMNWHFIGALQTNKVKYIVDKVALIHSVDSARLLDEIEKRSKAAKKVSDILLELNIGGESAKSGVSETEFDGLYRDALRRENIRVRGIMTVMPKDAPTQLFEKMQDMFEGLRRQNSDIVYLSMGMSSDYKTALKYGANIIRLGTAIFGARTYNI